MFTKFLIEGMRGFADRDNDFEVTLDEIHAYVALHVPSYVQNQFDGKEQTPYRVVSGAGAAPVVSTYKNRPYREEDLQVLVFSSLYGGPWQGDAPWLLPCLRSKIAGMLPKEIVTAKPIDGQTPIARPGLFSVDVQGVYERLEDKLKEYVNHSEKDVARQDLLRRLMEWDGVAEEEEKARILEGVNRFNCVHSTAVFTAHFAQEAAQEDEADALFLKARDLYEQQDPLPRGLLALCLADHAGCRSALNDYAQAASLYHDACHKVLSPDDAPLFSIQCLCGEAEARRKLADWDEVGECLAAAEAIAQKFLDPHHPLAAHIQERKAWQFMDQWRVTEAHTAFGKALAIWEENDKLDASKAIKQQTSKLHDQHGLAMTELYSGRANKAIELYLDLTEKITTIRDEGAGDFKSRQALTGRMVNTLERLADCYLFGTPQQPGRAVRALERAYGESEDLQADKTRDGLQALLLCKWGMALALSGDLEQAAEKLALRSKLMPKPSEDLTFYTSASDHLVSLLKPQTDEATIRTMQDFIKDSANAKELVPKRERLNLALFLADQVVARDAADSAAWELPFSVVPASSVREDVLPYIRPFYDRALSKVLSRTKPPRMGPLIRATWIAKTGKSPPAALGLDGGGLVVIYFASGPKGESLPGVALLEQEDNSGVVIPLPTLKEVLSLAKSGEKPALPAALITAKGQAERVRIHWHDGPQDLTNRQFPYELPTGWELIPDGQAAKDGG